MDCALSTVVVPVMTANYIAAFGRSSAYSNLLNVVASHSCFLTFLLFFFLYTDSTTFVWVTHLQPKWKIFFFPANHLNMCLPLDKCVFMCFHEERTQSFAKEIYFFWSRTERAAVKHAAGAENLLSPWGQALRRWRDFFSSVFLWL